MVSSAELLDAGAKLINKARREVGLLAIGITETFNRQHSQGSDLNGDQGEAFFQNMDAAVTGSRDNSGLVAVTANITQGKTSLATDIRFATKKRESA